MTTNQETSTQLELIKQILVEMETIKHNIRRLENIILKNHEHQIKVLSRVREAFLMNVDRDEELRETFLESANPWDGC